jgi:aldose 1-epimerase
MRRQVKGLLLNRASDSESTNVMPDGGEAQMTFHGGDFNGRWISQTEITTTVQLSSRAIEMTVISRKTGNEAEPVGNGLATRLCNHGRESRAGDIAASVSARGGGSRPSYGPASGKLLPVTGTEYDFTASSGAPPGSLNLNDSFCGPATGVYGYRTLWRSCETQQATTGCG